MALIERIFMFVLRQIRWSVPTSIQFSLVFANVGGVTGVWPWTKVKYTLKYLSLCCQIVSGLFATLSSVRIRCGGLKFPTLFVKGWGGVEMLARGVLGRSAMMSFKPAKLP